MNHQSKSRPQPVAWKKGQSLKEGERLWRKEREKKREKVEEIERERMRQREGERKMWHIMFLEACYQPAVMSQFAK